MNIQNFETGEVVGSVSVEEGELAFQLGYNVDTTLQEALLWAAAQPSLPLRSGGESNGTMYTEILDIVPEGEDYLQALSEFLVPYGYMLVEVEGEEDAAA